MANQVRIREWARLPYYNPEPILIELAKLRGRPLMQGLPYKVAALRTHALQPFLERRLGAIFFYLMGKAQQTQVLFAHVENADYDFVGYYKVDDEHRYVPVQMKELVPDFLNPGTCLQELIDSLRKYVDSEDLTVAISVNRIGTIRPGELDLSGLKLGGLWLFGSNLPDQSQWVVIGDLMRTDWHGVVYNHPYRPWHLEE